MPNTFREVPGWSFAADEVSEGVCRAFGRGPAGRNVDAAGLDPEVIIEKCRQAALQIVADAQASSGWSGAGCFEGDARRNIAEFGDYFRTIGALSNFHKHSR